MADKSDKRLIHQAQTNQNRESSLENTQEEIHRLIASLPSILIGLSKDNKIVLWNSVAEKVFDRFEADVIGQPLNQCGINWDWNKIASGIAESQTARQPIRVDDIRFQKPNGEDRFLGMTINCLDGDKHSILGSTIIGADITDRIKLKTQLQQSQKMEALGQLAAGIAHEINTPTQFVGDNTRFFQDAFEDLIAVIRDYEKLIEKAKSNNLTQNILAQAEDRIKETELDYLTEEIPIALQQTLKGVDRITKIVQAMKIFAHPGMAGKEPVDINGEIAKTITITRNEWKYVAEMKTGFDTDLPFVPCFRAELNQVILNMIVNAAHAIAEVNGDNASQKGVIHIRTCRNDNWAEIRISDTGAGIPEDIRPKIFDLFFTTKGPGKGSGQGLAISHSVVVDKHLGTLDLETREGKGTTFIIRLPLESAAEQND